MLPRWIKTYQQFGKDGLIDKRGRPVNEKRNSIIIDYDLRK